MLSLPFLGHQSLWLDEIYTRDIHRRDPERGGDVGALRPRADRSVPVCYLALRRLIGVAPALAAAGIVAVNPDLVGFALDARSYALLVLAGLVSMWAFAAVLERPSPRRYAAWALVCVAVVWTHYFGAFLVVRAAVALLTMLARSRRVTLAWCIGIAAGAAR